MTSHNREASKRRVSNPLGFDPHPETEFTDLSSLNSDEPTIAQTIFTGKIRKTRIDKLTSPSQLPPIRIPKRSELIAAFNTRTGEPQIFAARCVIFDTTTLTQNTIEELVEDPEVPVLNKHRKSAVMKTGTTRTFFDTKTDWIARGGDPTSSLYEPGTRTDPHRVSKKLR